ncbi:hypothetical protein HS7_19930 [Sulfolobales archaeon HS-7]|nr:hypothetical protein HS7_19930 [Sulfolobales archaeon HS-7]
MEGNCITLKFHNGKLLKRVLDRLRASNIKICEGSGLLVSDLSGDIIISNEQEIDYELGKILCYYRNKKYFNELLIGIDVNGYNSTIAVIGDGELLVSKVVTSDLVVEELKKFLTTYPHKLQSIGIGIGNSQAYEVYKIISKHFPITPVKEDRTSSNTKEVNIKDRDARAAYRIAFRATTYELK